MASNTEFVKSVLLLDGVQVSKVLEDLDVKAKKLGDDMVKALQAGDKVEYTKLNKELNQVEANQTRIKKGAFDVQNVLKNLNGTSLKDLEKSERSLWQEMKMATDKTSEAFKQLKTGHDAVVSQIKTVKSEMGATTSVAQQVGLSFKQAFAAFTVGGLVSQGITAVVSGIKNLWNGSVEAAEASEKANRLLATSLKGQEDEYLRLTDLAEKLQKSTGVDDETIKSQENFLVLQGRSEAQIKSMIQTALDMAAAVPDMSFDTALKQLDGTMEGTIGKMGKLDGSFKDLTPEQLAAGKAVEILGEKYKGTAEKATTLSDKLKVATDELKEAIGNSSVIDGFRTAWLDITETVTDFLKVPVSEKMAEEKTQVNILTMTLGDHNTALAIKKKAYEELVKLAPSVVEGIDLENISYSKLNENLKAYNEQAVAKIAIQSNDEKLAEVNKAAADDLTLLYESQNKLLAETFVTRSKLYEQGKGDQVKPLYEQYVTGKLSVLEYAKSIEKLVTGYDNLNTEIINQETMQKIYNKSQKEANVAAAETLKIRNDLIKQFGLEKAETILGNASKTEIIKKDKDESNSADDAAKAADDAAKAAEAAAKDAEAAAKDAEAAAKAKLAALKEINDETLAAYTTLNDKITSIRETMGLEAVSEDQKELDAITDKYDSEIDALQQNLTTSENLLYENQDKMAAAKASGNTEEYNLLVTYNNLLIDEISKGIDMQLALEDAKNAAIKAKTEEQNVEKLQLQSDINDKMAALFLTTKEKEKADKIKQYQDILDLAKKNGLDTTDLYKKVQDELNKLKDGVDVKGIFGLDEEGISDLKTAIQDVERTVTAFTNVWDSLNKLKSAREDNDTQRFLDRIEIQKKALKDQLDNKIISQKQYDSALDKLDDAANKKKNAAAYKQAKREGTLQKAQIGIQAVAAAAKAILEHWPWGIIEAVAIGASAGLQVAAIDEKIKSLPQAYEGKYPVKGASDGKTYNAGVMTNAKTGLLSSPTILAGEQPEIIIDPRTTKMIQMDYPGILNAIYMLSGRMPQFAAGKYPTNTITNNTQTINNDPEIKELLEKILTATEQPTRAKIVYSEFEQIKEKVDATRNRYGT
jgi:hypothetical protein